MTLSRPPPYSTVVPLLPGMLSAFPGRMTTVHVNASSELAQDTALQSSSKPSPTLANGGVTFSEVYCRPCVAPLRASRRLRIYPSNEVGGRCDVFAEWLHACDAKALDCRLRMHWATHDKIAVALRCPNLAHQASAHAERKDNAKQTSRRLHSSRSALLMDLGNPCHQGHSLNHLVEGE